MRSGDDRRRRDGARRQADYKRCLACSETPFRCGGAVAKSLPEFRAVEKDETLDQDNLRTKLTAWLLKERAFRLDSSTPSVPRISPGLRHRGGAGWTQCFGAPYSPDGQGELATTHRREGACLQEDLRHESTTSWRPSCGRLAWP